MGSAWLFFSRNGRRKILEHKLDAKLDRRSHKGMLRVQLRYESISKAQDPRHSDK